MINLDKLGKEIYEKFYGGDIKVILANSPEVPLYEGFTDRAIPIINPPRLKLENNYQTSYIGLLNVSHYAVTPELIVLIIGD